MGYSQGIDKRMFMVGKHEVLHDRLQIVVRHPMGCPSRGSGLDQGKTFHRWEQALHTLACCGEVLSETQVGQLTMMGREVDASPR